MRHKLFFWGEDFFIKDESGSDVFFVDGKAFGIGDQLSFQDLAGNELAVIEQKVRWFTWADTYGIEIGEEEDDVLILASTVVIDLACHTEEE